MADSFLELYVGTTASAKTEDAESVDFSGTTRYRQRNQVAGALSNEVARVMATTPGGSEMGLVVRVVGATTSTTITNVVPGVTGTALGKAIAATVGANDTGVGAWAQRRDTLVTLTPADGQYTPLFVDSVGALWTMNREMEQVIGSTDHGTTDTLYPVKIGGKASSTLPTAVTTGQRVNAYFDLNGRLVVAGALANGGLAVTERAATGTTTETHVTVNDSTANGVQLIAANSAGTRRRVIITNCSTAEVYVHPGATGLTAGAITVGRPLAGLVGAEQPWVTANELRATVDTGTAVVSVTEEVLA